MSEIQQLIGQMPVQQIAQQAGVDEADARQAIEAIVPALVGGMQANAHDPSGAQSLAGALGSHQGSLDARLAGDIDAADGERIVHNVFGDNTDQIARAAGGGSALGEIIKKVLPIVAPIVIAWIANKFFGQAGGQQTSPQQAPRETQQQEAQQQAPQPTGGGFDSPFGQGSPGATQPAQVPGGQQTQEQSQSQPQGGGLGLDDLLGGILGGGSGKGGLGDILGGLLGGGRR